MAQEQLNQTSPFPEFPSPNDPAKFPWVELRISTSNAGFSDNAPVVEDFWSLIVQKLKSIRSVDIQTPEDEAWFHLRRHIHKNEEPRERDYAVGQIEILRLKQDFIPDEIKEEIRCIPRNYPNVVGASWWGTKFDPRYYNAFLSFLQKLSVLRAVDRTYPTKYLGRPEPLYVNEAYRIMLSPNQPWSVPLAPWSAYFTSANLSPVQPSEYAHWFGHILSGWEGLWS